MELIYRKRFRNLLNTQTIETINFFNNFNRALTSCVQMYLFKDIMISWNVLKVIRIYGKWRNIINKIQKKDNKNLFSRFRINSEYQQLQNIVDEPTISI